MPHRVPRWTVPLFVRNPGLLTAAAVLLVCLSQALALFNPDFVVIDCEERFNAAHGVSLAQGHWNALLDLQYRNFCGGCTFDAAVGGLLFTILPPTFAAWKLVALAFSAAIAGVGVAVLQRVVHLRAAVLFLALIVLAPGTWVRLALLAWGNHYEAGLFCLALLFWAARPPSDRAHLGVGLFAGFALWFGFSSTYAVVALVGLLLLRRRFGALFAFLLGAASAPTLWWVQYLVTHQHPFGTIYVDGEAVPSLLRIPFKLQTLFFPRQLAGLFGVPRISLGAPLGIGVMAALLTATGVGLRRLARAIRERADVLPVEGVLALGWAVWLALYLVVEFRLELREGEGVPSAAGLRYAAPWMPMMWALLATMAHGWWAAGKRVQASLLIGPSLVSGVMTKIAILGAPFPDLFVFHLDAPDHENYRYVHSYALDPREHPNCTGEDENHRAAHAFAAGRHATLGLLGAAMPLSALPAPLAPEDAFYAGVGQALIDYEDSDAVGGLQSLEQIEERLLDLSEDGRLPALAESTWWRAYRDEPFGFARGAAASSPPLTRLLQATRPSSPALRHVALHSLGRRWGLVLGRWGQPGTVPFPAVAIRPPDLDGMRAFAEGYGFGLGTKWGPRATVPRPTDLPESVEDAFVTGLQNGVASQWSGTGAMTPTLATEAGIPWPIAGADRWWGPAPTMYCPCRASCW